MSLENCAAPSTGHLPRAIRKDLLWTGGCTPVAYQGRMPHSHMSAYCLKGSEKTILVDTGHPSHWGSIAPAVDEFLDGRELDYIFATHAEFPHDGLIRYWLNKYPNAKFVGDLRDYRLYYPHLVDRMINVKAGDRLDLGDREFIFVPAIWRDVNNSLWAFETGGRTLFVSDGFAILHEHEAGECDLLLSEQQLPDVDLIRFFNEAALQWTKFTDATVTFDEIDRLLSMLRPKVLAAAHGAVIDVIDSVVPLIKEGMIVKPRLDAGVSNPQKEAAHDR